MIEIALRQYLIADARVAAVLADRIYPGKLPQAVQYPAMTIKIVGGRSIYSMDGPSSLANPRVQFDLYGQEYDDVVALKKAFMAAMADCRGPIGTPSVVVQSAFRINEIEPEGQDLDGAGPRHWRKTVEFIIWHKEIY